MIRRRWCNRTVRAVTVVFITVVLTISWHYRTSNGPLLEQWRWWQSTSLAPASTVTNRPVRRPPPKQEPWSASSVLAGDVNTGNSFRDRLRNDTHYITCWTDGGFTNAVMTYANMIYLGIISNRVPIIPPFVAWHHIDASAGVLAFSDIFDLPAFKSAFRNHVVEWSDINNLPASRDQLEPIGCWSAWATQNLNENSPRGTTERIASYVGLDVSYTAVPVDTRRLLDNRYDWGLLFWRLAALIFPPPPGVDPLPGGLQKPYTTSRGLEILPDTQLACFDFLYFVTADNQDTFEWVEPWNTSWRTVARHMRFRKRLILLAQAYLRRAFEIPSASALPPFIAAHVRHGDFGGACGENTRSEDCFAPLSAYATRVKEVQAELREKKGIIVLDDHVLVISDETDPKFWQQVEERGWTYFDHKAMGTFKNYGEWYLTLIDVVSASLSAGFVGTDRSTVSTVNSKRVQDWNDGVTRMVKWGGPDADAH